VQSFHAVRGQLFSGVFTSGLRLKREGSGFAVQGERYGGGVGGHQVSPVVVYAKTPASKSKPPNANPPNAMAVHVAAKRAATLPSSVSGALLTQNKTQAIKAMMRIKIMVDSPVVD
jgi:hypothetical protein